MEQNTDKNSFLLIDPFVPTISRIDCEKTQPTLPIMYAAIECETVYCVHLGQTLDGMELDMWIDDEGAFREDQRQFAILDEDGSIMNVFSGRALIAASIKGATVGLDDIDGEFRRMVRRIGFFGQESQEQIDAIVRAKAEEGPQIITL